MAFFKSKDNTEREQLPELPGLPEMPELPALPSIYNKNEVKPLPKFPSTPMGESQGIGAIKNSLDENSERRTIELSDMNNRTITKPYTASSPTLNQTKSKEVFIKLDKFQDAVKKFEEIKLKVKEIEESLDKVREIKDKEEQELKSWEQEIQIVKNNVNNIDASLFNKI